MNNDYELELLLRSVTELSTALEVLAVLANQDRRVKEEIRHSFENMIVEIGETKTEMRQLTIETGCYLQTPNSTCLNHTTDVVGTTRS